MDLAKPVAVKFGHRATSVSGRPIYRSAMVRATFDQIRAERCAIVQIQCKNHRHVGRHQPMRRA
jgi:hypothetical protein